MPGEHRCWLHDMERRAPAGPSLRQPRPQQTINYRESEPWTAGTIHHGELVPECDDLQVQRDARIDDKSERVEQRDDDGPHACRLCNLNRCKAYGVFR